MPSGSVKRRQHSVSFLANFAVEGFGLARNLGRSGLLPLPAKAEGSTYHSFKEKCPVKKARILLSVMNESNDFQIEQVKGARKAAVRCGADLEILCAEDDGILQSQHLLQRIQGAAESRPDVIIFEPAG